jgi:DNA-binding transcriptional ArsR family regulator
MQPRTLGSPRGRRRKDQLFDVLADPYRRIVLSRLFERAEPVSVDDLAAEVAEATESRAVDVPAGDSRRIGIRLHHVHLPKLASAGLVEREDDLVRPTELAAEVRPLVDWAEEFPG